MKSLRANILLAFLGCVTVTAYTQSAEKTLVKSFNLQGMQSVVLDLDGMVEVREWNNDIMRIQMVISLPNGNEHMLKTLIKARRYNLSSKIDNSEFIVYAPALQKEVSVGGRMMEEKINYIINAPKDVIVRIADSATTLQNKDTKAPSSL